MLLLTANEEEKMANLRRERKKNFKLFILFVDAIYLNHFEMCRFNRSQGNNVVC